ncbi:MAG: ABC transporter substrate-binding protein [Bifidobacteriaceae bacterium]|jgi:peptide/nickel transport system substrate-binding protein|nr:ABC transporter substrate-binding protein [Bifidobacteriaceae bacterium]
MSIRTRAAAALAAAALVFSLSACGSDEPSASGPTGSSGSTDDSAAAGQPVEGGTLYWAVATAPPTINPQLNGLAKVSPLLRNVYTSYLYLTEDGVYEPWLAAGYEESEDGLTVTLSLREGVTFSDGEPLNADAVLANFDKITSEGYGYGTPAGLRNVSAINKVDDLTVEFVLGTKDILFLQFLAGLGSTPLSPKSLELEQTVLESGGPELAGVGPFVITEYTANTELVLEKRADYKWAPASIANGQTAAYLDKVVYRILPEGATRTGALEQGQVQAASDIQPLDVGVFEGREGFQYIRSFLAGSPYFIAFNPHKAPLDDIRVRQAFILGSDLDAIIEAVYHGAYDRAWAPVSTRGPWAADLVGWNTTDVDKANELLDQAGWTERDAEGIRLKDGKPLRIELYTDTNRLRESRDQVHLALSAALKENVGIDYHYEVVDSGTAAELNGGANYSIIDPSYLSPDPAGLVDTVYHSDPTRGTIGQGTFKDATLDQLIDTGRFTTDLETRITAYKELQEYLTTENWLVLPVYEPQDSVAATDKVKNITIDGLGQPFGAYTIWLEP